MAPLSPATRICLASPRGNTDAQLFAKRRWGWHHPTLSATLRPAYRNSSFPHGVFTPFSDASNHLILAARSGANRFKMAADTN
jgi:hypothetical protein